MNPDETADAKVMVAEGGQPGEGSSATPEAQQPNTPENQAGSGVQPRELPVEGEVAEQDDGAATAAQEPVEPAADDTEEPKLPQDAKAGTKKAFDRLLNQKRALEEMVRQSGLQPIGGIQKPPVSQPQQQPIAPTVVPDNDPIDSQIAQQEAYWQQAHQAWQSIPEGDPARERFAAMANQTYKQIEALREQKIVRRVATQMQSFQSQQARNAEFWGEVAEVNNDLHPELRFIDGTGRINPESNTWKAMCNVAFKRFDGMSPEQLAMTPDVLAYTANAVLRRINGAASQAAFTKTEQLKTKQKMLKKQVGLETGGAAAKPEPPGANRRVKELMQKRKAGTITRPELLELGSHLV